MLCLFVIIRKFDILHLKRSDWVLDASYVRNLLIMGLPMGLQYSITAIGSVILQTAVNTLGSGAVAAMTAGSRISMCARLTHSVLPWQLTVDKTWVPENMIVWQAV